MATCSNCEKAVADNCELCEECGEEGEENNEATGQSVNYVKSELLAYACTYVNRCSPDALVQSIIGFYNAEDILCAQNVLWNTYSDVLDDSTKRRCTLKSTSATVNKVVEDIVFKGLLVLANSDIGNFPFCAVDITKIPKFSPEEENLQSVLVRLARLEHEMKSVTKVQNEMEHDVKSVTKVQNEMKQDVDYATRMVQQTNAKITQASGLKSSHCDVDFGLGASASVDLGLGASASAATVEWPRRPRTPYTPLPPPSQPLRDIRNNMSVNSSIPENLDIHAWKQPLKEAGLQTKSNEEWEIQRADRRKRIRELNSKARTVTGNQTNSNITSVGPTSAIYVHDIDMDVTDQAIKNLISGKGVHVKQMIQILGRNNRGFLKSFKVVIPSNKFEDVMSAEFWPSGIKCREWIQDNQ